MIKITKNNWRPFIELTPIADDGDEGTLYFDVTKRPVLIQTKENTIIYVDDCDILVKEKAKDIIKAVDKLIAAEQDRKAEQAREYMKATQERVAATAAMVEGK